MLLTISTTHRPATDLGCLLHKHPDRFQSFDLSFGQAHVFYPEVAEDRCTAALLLDVDPVGMVRAKGRNQKPVAWAVRQRQALRGLVVHERGDLASVGIGHVGPL
jgi:RNA repair, ligase-Pnkp-associating, region of Hen1